MGLGEGGRKRAVALRYLVGSPSHKNLAACVSVQLASCLAQLRRAEQVRARSETNEEGQASEERRPAQTRAIQHAQLARQAERTACKIRLGIQHGSGLKSGINEVYSTVSKQLWRQRGCYVTWNGQPFTT